MLHLIERVLPAPMQRALMPLAHRIRHRWRQISARPIAGVSVIISNPCGEVLLLRHSYGPDAWLLPGGGLKKGEPPEDCARREMEEELGLTLGTLQPIATLKEELSGSPHTAHLFAATCEARPVPDRREVIEARFFEPSKLPENIGDLTRTRIEAWHAWQSPDHNSES